MEIKEAFQDAVRSERMRNRARDPRSGTYGRPVRYGPQVLARQFRENPTVVLMSALGLGILVAAAYGGWEYTRNRNRRRLWSGGRRRSSRSVLDKLYVR